jgi:di/tricarboxylate transporter
MEYLNRCLGEYWVDMTPEAWFSLGITLLIFIALIRDLAPPDLSFVSGAGLLVAVQVITPAEAFAGFANPGVMTVAAMFVIAAGLRETGVLNSLGHTVLAKARTGPGAIRKLATLVIPLSAVLNNTPIVAMFLPVVLDWCRQTRIAPSKVLIPLSYMTIFGGTCTLIGTSTNLVVNGLMQQAFQSGLITGLDPEFLSGLQDLHLFELSWVGLPYAAIGMAYLYGVGQRLLPERRELMEQLGETRREYLLEMLVESGCRLCDQTVETAGLRHLPGLFLIEINRQGHVIAPVSPETVLRAKDRLVFTGVVSSIVELEKIPGLTPVVDPSYEVSPDKQQERLLCEAVISPSSPLVGKTIRGANFRAVYGAAVVAVHRNGARLATKVGDIELRPGDTLLLQTNADFLRAHRNNPAFYLVSDVDGWRPLRRHRAWIAVSLLLLLLLLMITGVVEIAIAAILVACLMVALGCLSASEARKSIDWPVLITIAASFGVGTALDKSGAAALIAQAWVQATSSLGPIVALAGIYLFTSILTELITNNAAAVVLFPFCIELARLYDASPRAFLICLALAASASFVTPIGYQTNMMVYGPGGYRFGDFIRMGLPLKLILWGVTVLLVPLVWPL